MKLRLVDDQYYAELLLFRAESSYEADILVWKVQSPYDEDKSPAFWYFTDDPYDDDAKKAYWVQSPYGINNSFLYALSLCLIF